MVRGLIEGVSLSDAIVHGHFIVGVRYYKCLSCLILLICFCAAAGVYI